MDKVILIKYGELSTKKGNRNFFIRTLYDNLESKLEVIQHIETKKEQKIIYRPPASHPWKAASYQKYIERHNSKKILNLYLRKFSLDSDIFVNQTKSKTKSFAY